MIFKKIVITKLKTSKLANFELLSLHHEISNHDNVEVGPS